MIKFAWFWIVVILPLPIIMQYLLPVFNTTGSALKVPFFSRMGTLSTSVRNKSKKNIFAYIIWCLLVIAAMRPQYLGEPLGIPITGRDILMAVDISKSMSTPDFDINGEQVIRLDVVKAVASKFIERRKGDRIGLILFGSRAYLHAPLTFDRLTVKQLLLEAEIGFAGNGTAIGDAIGISLKRLKEYDKVNRVLVLLTDGQNTAGEISPKRATQLAKLEKLKIYTIGIGAEKMSINTLFGRQTINPSKELNESMLRSMAKKTGGQYFRAKDTESLEKIYEKLDSLEPVSKDDQFYRNIAELYHYPLALALAMSVLIALLYVTPKQVLRVERN